MTSERWTRVKEIFAEALDRSAADRVTYLAEACGSDAELRGEVERLLAQAGLTLKSPVGALLVRIPEFNTGELLAQYRVENKLGEGGMGAVYRAFDTLLQRPVALKVVPPDPLGGGERTERLMSEARAASALNHPNIVTVYETGAARGVEFIAMECVDGQSLASAIPAAGLPVRRALEFAIQIADALAQAHSAGVVHRDLKPANVMISASGRVKLLDFGLAQRVRTANNERADTSTQGEIAGTPAYMSPEQAEGKPADERSDVFSFGAVLYEMLTGRRAFPGGSSTSVIAGVLRDDPPPMAGRPPELAKLVSRCLRKDPVRRFQHMGDVRMLLEDLMQEAPPPSPVVQRRWPGYIAAAAVLLTAIGTGVWYFALKHPPHEAMRLELLTTYVGQVRDPTFSPDGKQIAFAWNGAIHAKLASAGAQPLRLSSGAGDTGTTWSPDGNLIAFRRSGGNNGIYVVSPLGGAERKIADVGRLGQEILPHMSWSPDGKWLAAPERAADGITRIFLFPLGAGEKRQATFAVPVRTGVGGQETSPAPGIDQAPAFSPDGRLLAYASCSYVFPCDLYVQELGLDYMPNGRPPERITHQESYIRGLSWMPDSRHLVYAAGLGTMQTNLWRVAVFPAGAPERIELAGDQVRHPAVSRVGDLLVFSRFNRDADIWKYDVGGQAAPFLASTVFDYQPAFSPDGAKIAFCSQVSGSLEIWVADRTGNNRVQLTDRLGRSADSPAWSPDGRWIAFESLGNDGHSSIQVMEAVGGLPRRITPGGYDALAPAWSRDGKTIYFSRPTGARVDLWRIPVEGGEASQVTDNGGMFAGESGDGKSIYYTKDLTNSLLGYVTPIYSRPLAGGPEREVIPDSYWDAFSIVDEGIYYVRQSSEAPGLAFYDFASGRTKALSRIPGTIFNRITVSPDRKTVLFGVLKAANWELVAIRNFQ